MESPCTIDSKIKIQLESLNSASERINTLENILTEKRNVYRTTLTESTQHLNAIAKRLGDSIAKARPYFDARNLAKQALQEAQKAAIKYERAVSMHNAAREMVSVAEQGMLKDGRDANAAWPDMLNHATQKVNDAEIERIKSELEHQQRAKLFKNAEQEVKKLERSLRTHINKSRQYFAEKEETQKKIQELTQSVKEVDETLSQEKCFYSQALHELENISEDIHASRQSAPYIAEREPGVGAESARCNLEEVVSIPVIHTEQEVDKRKTKKTSGDQEVLLNVAQLSLTTK